MQNSDYLCIASFRHSGKLTRWYLPYGIKIGTLHKSLPEPKNCLLVYKAYSDNTNQKAGEWLVL
jgi:hypothetical protein